MALFSSLRLFLAFIALYQSLWLFLALYGSFWLFMASGLANNIDANLGWPAILDWPN
jgi:hypothetical protein